MTRQSRSAVLAALTFALMIVLASQCHAQSKDEMKSEVTTLKEENSKLKEQLAMKDIEIANLKIAVLQNQANPIASDRAKAISVLQAAHPDQYWSERAGALIKIPAGMSWDAQNQQLVPQTPPPNPPAPAPAK